MYLLHPIQIASFTTFKRIVPSAANSMLTLPTKSPDKIKPISMLDSGSVVRIATTKVVLLVGCTVVKTTCLIKVVLNDKEMSAALIPRTFARASLMASKLDSVTAGVKTISLVIVTGPAKHKLFHGLFFNINCS